MALSVPFHAFSKYPFNSQKRNFHTRIRPGCECVLSSDSFCPSWWWAPATAVRSSSSEAHFIFQGNSFKITSTWLDPGHQCTLGGVKPGRIWNWRNSASLWLLWIPGGSLPDPIPCSWIRRKSIRSGVRPWRSRHFKCFQSKPGIRSWSLCPTGTDVTWGQHTGHPDFTDEIAGSKTTSRFGCRPLPLTWRKHSHPGLQVFLP